MVYSRADTMVESLAALLESRKVVPSVALSALRLVDVMVVLREYHLVDC